VYAMLTIVGNDDELEDDDDGVGTGVGRTSDG
jgi:hypothetical protein